VAASAGVRRQCDRYVAMGNLLLGATWIGCRIGKRRVASEWDHIPWAVGPRLLNGAENATWILHAALPILRRMFVCAERQGAQLGELAERRGERDDLSAFAAVLLNCCTAMRNGWRDRGAADSLGSLVKLWSGGPLGPWRTPQAICPVRYALANLVRPLVDWLHAVAVVCDSDADRRGRGCALRRGTR